MEKLVYLIKELLYYVSQKKKKKENSIVNFPHVKSFFCFLRISEEKPPM